jgi:hypothetical protein
VTALPSAVGRSGRRSGPWRVTNRRDVARLGNDRHHGWRWDGTPVDLMLVDPRDMATNLALAGNFISDVA